MFLQKVYKHSKLLFLAMLGFIAGQLFINYKHGVVCSPFYHYGMYSEVMKVRQIPSMGNRSEWQKIIRQRLFHSTVGYDYSSAAIL